VHLRRKSWWFVTHESEIPNQGDYRTFVLDHQPVLVVRDDGGQVWVLFNICRHRRVKVCHEEKGNTCYFQCPYHGWLYDTKGNFVGVSGGEYYGTRFRKETTGLTPVPRTEMYQGFIFASFTDEGESLHEYLKDTNSRSR
jgi:phenylpropionate dioxygenase-like ring-hydroxylating dioxygenase large terminal subunit